MLTQDLLELYAEQWLGAVDGAGALGCDLICFCGRALDAPGFRKQANAIYDLVGGEALDGLVVWTSVLGIFVGPERLAEFCRRFDPLPMVSVEQPLGTAPLVVMENRQGMCAAVRHLVEVHRRRRIAFLRGPAHHAGALQRYQGYRDALARHGLIEHAELVSAPPPAWLPEEAAAAVSDMLARGTPPDAIVAANDDFAVAALSALAASGAGTRDIPVVGFDDFTNIRTHDLGFDSGSDEDPGAVRRAVNISASSLSLTTVRAPFHEMGRRSVELVLAMLRGEPVPPVVSVPTQLVVRRSCGCRPTAWQEAPADPVAGQRPTIRLRQALSQQSAPLPPDWPETLAASFVSAIQGRSAEEFLGPLDALVQVSLRAGESIENWWRVLYALRQLIGYPTAGAGELSRSEDLWLHAQLLLNETAERYWRYGTVLAEKRNQIVREVGQELITAVDLTELAATLAEQLPRLGIPGCYLAAYESAAEGAAGPAARTRSRLLLGYEDGAPIDLPADAAVFESVRLVPGDHLRRAVPSSVVAAPVYFRDQQLGFVLFELGPRLGWIYAALQEQLGSALHRAFLVERERVASAAVEEAHRREERHRLASELHDSVSQALFSMNLHTRAVQLAVQQEGGDPDGRVARGLAELRDLTQGALTEMRALIFQLRPDALHEEGLVAAVRRHAAAVAAREGFAVRVHAAEGRLPLDEQAERELFRVVQEALHNSVKHARPSRVDIRMVRPDGAAGTLVVEVADDGAGFDPGRPYPGHLGLAGMRERTQRLGGRFAVDASAAGTTVRAVLPGILRRTAEAPTASGTRG
jgi:signal transduction histidine kinase/DNA-binding LacI/PurR family transcriptional regulator